MAKENGFFQSTSYHVLVFLVLLTTLAFSIMAFYNSKQIKEFAIPKPLDVKDFMAKLRAHPEMKDLQEVDPLNIVQITNANLQSLQTQIRNLDISFLGSFLVQYKDSIVVYNYLNNTKPYNNTRSYNSNSTPRTYSNYNQNSTQPRGNVRTQTSPTRSYSPSTNYGGGHSTSNGGFGGRGFGGGGTGGGGGGRSSGGGAGRR